MMTVGELDTKLNAVGMSIRHVRTITVDRTRFDDVGLVVLVIESFALDDKGRRYIDAANGGAAVEVRRFFVSSIGQLTPTPSSDQPEVEQ